MSLEKKASPEVYRKRIWNIFLPRINPPQFSAFLRPGTYKWWVVFMLWFVCFFNYADRQAISSVLPLLKRDFGFNPVQLGLLGSSFAWVYGGLAWAAGMVADRISRKRLIVAACVGWSFFTLGTAWCGNFSMFVI